MTDYKKKIKELNIEADKADKRVDSLESRIEDELNNNRRRGKTRSNTLLKTGVDIEEDIPKTTEDFERLAEMTPKEIGNELISAMVAIYCLGKKVVEEENGVKNDCKNG